MNKLLPRFCSRSALIKSGFTTVHGFRLPHFKFLGILLLTISYFLFIPIPHARAALSACSASVSPNSVEPGASQDFSFNVTNDDDADGRMRWIKISRPSGSYTITGYSSNGLSVSQSDSDFSTWGFDAGSGGSFGQGLSVQAGSNAEGAASWSVQASDDTGGGGAVSCGGDTSTSISSSGGGGGGGGGSSPSISNVVVSAGASSATFTWSTDSDSDSSVDYGTDSSYGSNQSSGTQTSSHSLTAIGLLSSTTYHYNIKSTNSNGTTAVGDNSFTTAAPGESTVTSTGTSKSGTSSNGKTIVVTATPTPTPIPDRTPPSVTLDTDFSTVFAAPPVITGTAYDPSGVGKIEYSIDGGRNFLPVDLIKNPGFRSTTFEFVPQLADDDNYKLKIRSQDNSPQANSGVSKEFTLIIDRLPPQVSGDIISIGPQVLSQNQNGYIVSVKGVNQKITLSAIGGPIKLDLYITQNNATQSGQIVNLVKSEETGLWSGEFAFNNVGKYSLYISGVDGAGNKLGRFLDRLSAIEPGRILNHGKPVKDAKVSIYFLENNSQRWTLWDGASFGQTNPQKTDSTGQFGALLPEGKYYFDIEAPGYKHTVSSIFDVNDPVVINSDFTLSPLKLLFGFWIFKIYLPDFSTQTVPVTLKLPTLSKNSSNLINHEAPIFSLPTLDGNESNISSLRGSPIVLTFLNIWNPQISEQISAEEELKGKTSFKPYVVMVGSTKSKVTIFAKRGGYKIPIFIDQDATLSDPYGLNSMPAHYFIDRFGVVKRVEKGVLSESDLEEALLGIQ